MLKKSSFWIRKNLDGRAQFGIIPMLAMAIIPLFLLFFYAYF